MTEAIRFEVITPLSPNVEAQLIHCISTEVDVFTENVVGRKCLLCPFRTFVSRLKKHMESHWEKNWFLADKRSSQRAVVRALYDYIQAS